MTDSYIDTSALAKRYVRESGSRWVVALTNPRNRTKSITSVLVGPEVMSALVRKMRTGSMTPDELRRAGRLFRREWRQLLHVRDVSPTGIDRAMLFVERHGPRGHDAVHLATALAVSDERQQVGLSPLVFVSADRTQLAAARAEGLGGENPNDYP